MDPCLTITTLIPLLGFFITLLVVLVRDRPPCTPMGRALYLSLSFNAVAIAFVLICHWFPPWSRCTPSLPADVVEIMANDDPMKLIVLGVLGYFALGMLAYAVLGRAPAEEEAE